MPPKDSIRAISFGNVAKIAHKGDPPSVGHPPLTYAANGTVSFQNAKGVFGLATGYGLDDNIMDAYRFVCQRYEDGDRLFFFGFGQLPKVCGSVRRCITTSSTARLCLAGNMLMSRRMPPASYTIR